MRSLTGSFSLLAGLIAIFGISCASVGDPDPRLAKLKALEEGCREELALAHYLEAREIAATAVNSPSLMTLDDVVVDQLRFCFTTARTLNQLAEISSDVNNFIQAVSNLLDKRKAGTSAAEFKAQAALIDDVMRALLDPTAKLLEENQEQYDAILARNRFHWEPARIPVYVADLELLDAGADYDMGELRVISAMNRAFLANLYMLRGLTYPVNLQAVSTYATLEVDTPLKQFEQRPIWSMMNAIVILLATQKDFLSLEPENGTAEIQHAGASLSGAVGDLLLGIEAMKARPSDQSGHLIEYKREANNDYFIVHAHFKTNLDTQLELNKYDDTTIWLKEDVVASFLRLKDSLDGVEGVRANLQKDIFPIAALVSVVLLSSGALDAIIAEVLKSIDQVLARKLRITVDLGSLNQDYVLASLLAVVPMEMEIDFNQMFRKPTGLRNVMPAWTQPITAPAANDTAMSAFTDATFVFEYECSDNPLATTAKSVLCTNPVDSPHFADQGAFPWQNDTMYDNFGPRWEGEITADGILSTSPYIAFKDPTFGDVLYIDVTNIAKTELPAKGMVPATQKSLNATLAEVVDLLITIY